MTNKRTGPRSKCTDKTISEIAALVAEGNYVEQACKAVGIGQSTYYLWKEKGNDPNNKDKQYKKFVEAIEQAEALSEAKHVRNITRAAKTTWQASAWLLERKHGDRWGRKDKMNVEAETKSEVTINVQLVDEDEE